MSEPGATAALAGFVAGTAWDDVPERARHEAKRAILNILATTFAGCREGALEIAFRSLREFSDRQQATVIGRRERVDTLSGAFLNAAAANVLDFCDTHLATVIHPTAPVVPALLALAERRRTSGRDLLTAFVLGCEVECRVGLTVSPGHYRRGWHITSTCGVFGSAAGSGKLLGLDAGRMVWALGNAATQASGLCECLGTSAKSISVGNAARNGLWSALLAEQGFDGPARPIEGVQGYLGAVGEVSDPDALTRGLGDTWEILGNALKPYPCGVVIHPVIDAVLDLQGEHHVPAGAIDRVVVRGHPLLRQRADRCDIVTAREAQVSVQHCVAVAILHGRVGPDHFTDTVVRSPDVAELRKRIEVVESPDIRPEGAAVELVLADGTRHSTTVEHARGSIRRPMSDADVEDKMIALAGPHLGEPTARSLIDAVWTLDRSDDAASLLALTVPR